MDGRDEAELSQLREDIRRLNERLARLESRLTAEAPRAVPPAHSPPPPPPQPTTVPPPKPVGPPPPPAPYFASDARTPAAAPPEIPLAGQAKVAAKPAVSLEQRVGASWLNKVGIIVLVLGAVFFLQYAAQRGWINPSIRVAVVAGAGLAMLAIGERAIRRQLRAFAAGLTGGGIAMLYLAAYAASPKFYGLVPISAAFALMCVVTAIGVALSLRSGLIVTAVLVQIGGYLTPMLLSTGQNQQVVLMCYLLALGAGFLTVAIVKSWDLLAGIALLGTILLFQGWFALYYEDGAAVRTLGFGWAFFALFAVYAAVSAKRSNLAFAAGEVVLVAAGAALAVLSLAVAYGVEGGNEALPNLSATWNLLALVVSVLSLCQWCGWNRLLRPASLVWSAAGLACLKLLFAEPWTHWSQWHWAAWIWVFWGLYNLDLLVRAWRRGPGEAVDAGISVAAMALMFWSTYALFHPGDPPWLGSYAFGLAGLSLVTGLAVQRLFGRRILAGSYLWQGLVLLTLGMAIQFHGPSLTIAWGAQALASMIVARRLGSKMLVAQAVAALALAVGRFNSLEQLSQVVVNVGGAGLTQGLLLAVGISAVALLMAALTAVGKRAFSETEERSLAGVLTWGAAALYAMGTIIHLPALTGTWWWLALAATIATVGIFRGREWIALSGLLMLIFTAAKFLYDSIFGGHFAGAVVLNWQCALGVVLAVVCLAAGRGAAKRPGSTNKNLATLITVVLLAGALLILWSGTLEISRYYRAQGRVSSTGIQGKQMAYSIWWALYAAVLLAAGFLAHRPAIRYMALALFGVTLVKVMLVDLASVGEGYRIASFVGLGAMLVAGSYLYHRHFRAVMGDGSRSDPPPADGSVPQ